MRSVYEPCKNRELRSSRTWKISALRCYDDKRNSSKMYCEMLKLIVNWKPLGKLQMMQLTTELRLQMKSSLAIWKMSNLVVASSHQRESISLVQTLWRHYLRQGTISAISRKRKMKSRKLRRRKSSRWCANSTEIGTPVSCRPSLRKNQRKRMKKRQNKRQQKRRNKRLHRKYLVMALEFAQKSLKVGQHKRVLRLSRFRYLLPSLI